MLFKLWHEVPAGEAVSDHPQKQRQHQPPVRGGQQEHGADEIDKHVNDDVSNFHHRIAHAQRRLHHLGGETAGKVVLEILHALPQHIAMRQPAGPHGEIAAQALVRRGFAYEIEGRLDDQGKGADKDELEAVVLPESCTLCLGEKIHQAAEEAVEIDFDERDDEGKQYIGDEKRRKWPGVEPDKRQQPQPQAFEPRQGEMN